jgi:hypothetical protein
VDPAAPDRPVVRVREGGSVSELAVEMAAPAVAV